jgi:Tfp pilus assembly protein PilN
VINLLPPELKQDILYARRNTMLFRWCLTMLVVTALLLSIVFIGQVYIDSATRSYSTQVALSRQQLKDQQLDETRERVAEFGSNMQLGIQVLSRQVVYSALLNELSDTIPANAVLNDLRLTQLEGGIDLQFRTRDEQTASRLQQALQDPVDQQNRIFRKADILSLSCVKAGTENYPCTVNIRAAFNEANPFLITNRISEGGEQR